MSRPLRGDGSDADRLTRAAGASSAALLATACAVQVAAYASFFNLTPLFPEVGADLGMDAGALGALVGFGGIVSLLAQLPAGSGGDTFGRRPFFAVGLVLACLGLLLRWQAYAPVTLLLGPGRGWRCARDHQHQRLCPRRRGVHGAQAAAVDRHRQHQRQHWPGRRLPDRWHTWRAGWLARAVAEHGAPARVRAARHPVRARACCLDRIAPTRAQAH